MRLHALNDNFIVDEAMNDSLDKRWWQLGGTSESSHLEAGRDRSDHVDTG